METKSCFKCNQTKPICDFYEHPQMADGHLGKCKECTKLDTQLNYRKNFTYYKKYDFIRSQTKERRERVKQYFKDHPEARTTAAQAYRNKYPEKYTANCILNNQVNRKGFQKEPCSYCGRPENVHGHHENYSKPLDVIWLCPTCHSTLHRERRQVANESN